MHFYCASTAENWEKFYESERALTSCWNIVPKIFIVRQLPSPNLSVPLDESCSEGCFWFSSLVKFCFCVIISWWKALNKEIMNSVNVKTMEDVMKARVASTISRNFIAVLSASFYASRLTSFIFSELHNFQMNRENFPF